MQNIFTPIEVPFKNTNFDQYSYHDLSKFNQAMLYQITQPTINSVKDEQIKVIEWLKKLSPSQRQAAVTFTNKQFACLLREMYFRLEYHYQSGYFSYEFSISVEHDLSNYTIEERQPYSNPNQKKSQAVIQLLNQIQILSKYNLFDSVTISSKLLNDVERLFALISIIEDDVFHDLTKQQFELIKNNSNDLIFFDPTHQDHKFIGNIVAEVLSLQIMLAYRDSQEKLKLEAERSVSNAKQYAKLWKEIEPMKRHELISKSLSYPIQDLIFKDSSQTKVRGDHFPRVLKTHKQAHKKWVLNLVNCNPKQIFNLLTITPIEDSMQEINYYKMEVKLEVMDYLRHLRDKDQMERNKVKMCKKNKKKKKKGQIKEKQFVNVDKVEETEKPLVSSRVHKEQVVAREVVQVLSFTNEESIKEAERKKSQQSQQFIVDKKFSDTTNDQNQLQQKEQQIKLMDQQKQKSQRILQIYQKIQQQSKNEQRYRKIILNRISFILLTKIDISCKAYGSYDYKIAIKDSDLDIIVDSSITNYFYLDNFNFRIQIGKSLSLVQSLLEGMDWVEQFVCLPAASVPLLSFKAYPNRYFDHKQHSKMRLNLKKNQLQNTNDFIMVDITIQPYLSMNEPIYHHMGIESTQLIKQWLLAYPSLDKIILLTKYWLKKHQLNKNYTGGLSSFALIVFSVAFMKIKGLEDQSQNWTVLFEEFVFFVSEFEEQKYSVDLTFDNPIRKGNFNKLILINPLNKALSLTEKSFKFLQIKKGMKELHKNSKQINKIFFQ